jgi:hypothetical protein
MKISTDIDIDFQDRTKALEVLPHIPALMFNNGKPQRHNTGIYFQNIPTNPLTNIASIQYEAAEDLGYLKIDFINNSIYTGIKDSAHLTKLMNTNPEWDLLADRDFVSLLAHIHSHFHIVDTIKPKSVTDLAIILALIRPGKRYLLNELRSKIDSEIWTPPSDGAYYFKKSHSFSYSLSIVVQMNLLTEQIMKNE